MPCVYLPGPAPAVTVANTHVVTTPKIISSLTRIEKVSKCFFKSDFRLSAMHTEVIDCPFV